MSVGQNMTITSVHAISGALWFNRLHEPRGLQADSHQYDHAQTHLADNLPEAPPINLGETLRGFN